MKMKKNKDRVNDPQLRHTNLNVSQEIALFVFSFGKRSSKYRIKIVAK